MAKINYSIIIPHKNIPLLLKRCLTSIPRRDDVEIIIVDDNSDPAIVDFNCFPGMNDPYVKIVYTKEGKGAGYARNVGLSKANGVWVIFADADDFFNYCFNDILTEYIDNQADIVFFKASCLDSDYYTNSERAYHHNLILDSYFKNREKSEKLLRYKLGWPHTKFLKEKLISDNNVRFDEIPILNDTTFSYLTGHYAKSVIADKRAVYCLTTRLGSLQFSELSVEKRLAIIYVSAKFHQFIKENNIKVHSELYERMLIIFLFHKGIYNDAKKMLINMKYKKSTIIIGLYRAFFLQYIFEYIVYIPRYVFRKFAQIYRRILKLFQNIKS
jgi:glycosyltransferase involved in cell wall biosynthesis